MPMTRTFASACRHLASAVVCVMFVPVLAVAGPIRVEITNYVVSVGDPRADYFNGKLLTANDLADEQSYARSSDRYIGETARPLSELFLQAGRADVVLLFDEADALFGERTDVEDGHDRYAEDFIVLDLEEGTWRGRLFVGEVDGLPDGIYAALTGRFEALVVIPEPTTLSVCALGILAIAGLRRRRGVIGWAFRHETATARR